jgi:hypothetical protein
MATDPSVLKELRDVAAAKLKSEDDRQASITTRAQSLFTTLTLFGFVLTFGVTLLTTTSAISRESMVVCCPVALYVIIQIGLIVDNILSAVGGIATDTTGSSDLASWAKRNSVADVHRAQALLYLDHDRRHSLTNTWRFKKLACAFRGFRNIVFSLCLFALILFGLAVFRPQATLAPAAPCPVYVRWCTTGQRRKLST